MRRFFDVHGILFVGVWNDIDEGSNFNPNETIDAVEWAKHAVEVREVMKEITSFKVSENNTMWLLPKTKQDSTIKDLLDLGLFSPKYANANRLGTLSDRKISPPICSTSTGITCLSPSIPTTTRNPLTFTFSATCTIPSGPTRRDGASVTTPRWETWAGPTCRFISVAARSYRCAPSPLARRADLRKKPFMLVVAPGEDSLMERTRSSSRARGKAAINTAS
ncbi:hypothetical protein MGN70_000813 [Eutypa lata]|nr:hypothetical protein MGN70_000813 [Eutypa lata]